MCRPGLASRRELSHAFTLRETGRPPEIGVAKAAYFPTISLTGLLGFESNQLSSLFKGASNTWQFVPQVTQPIFTAGRITAQVRLTEAQQQRALIQYEKAIQTAFREVADALVQYRRVKEIRTQQTLLVTTLQGRSQLAYMRYQGGVDTLLNALDADRDLFNAELSLAQTERNELLALVQLYKALGGAGSPNGPYGAHTAQRPGVTAHWSPLTPARGRCPRAARPRAPPRAARGTSGAKGGRDAAARAHACEAP